MNIDVGTKVKNRKVDISSVNKNKTNNSVKFADELKNLIPTNSNKNDVLKQMNVIEEKSDIKKDQKINSSDEIDEVITGLEGVVAEVNDKKAKEDAQETSEVDSEEKDKEVEESSKNDKMTENTKEIKDTEDAENEIDEKTEMVEQHIVEKENVNKDFLNNIDINKNNSEKEDSNLINNNMNIPDDKKDDLSMQMNANMNFSGDGTPFSDLMKNNNQQTLSVAAKDLAEEKAILSTMDENIMIANRNRAMINTTAETSNTADSINKSNAVENKKAEITNSTQSDIVVKSENIIMSENDVDFFVRLVEQGQVEATQATAKAAKVSKALADLIAKAMNDNKPVRIDFDNNISVIIRISRDGKISADFLPSTQIAEAYLRENLPLLKQKLDDNHIEYGELNQRQHKKDEQDDNQKKGHKDE